MSRLCDGRLCPGRFRALLHAKPVLAWRINANWSRRCKKWATHHDQWLHDVPLRSGENAITVNGFGVEISDDQGAVTYHNSCITDMPVDRGNVAAMVGSISPP